LVLYFPGFRHGRRKGGGKGEKAPLDFEKLSKKKRFRVGKNKFTTFGPDLEKFFKNPLVTPPGKILPTPMVSASSTLRNLQMM